MASTPVFQAGVGSNTRTTINLLPSPGTAELRPIPVTSCGKPHRERELRNQPRKRKRDSNVESDYPEGHSPGDHPYPDDNQINFQRPEYSAVITPDERSQYLIAGLPLNQNPAPAPFPHAPAPAKEKVRYKGIPFAEASAPITTSREGSYHGTAKLSLHKQHLGALMTILYRSLSERDFARAERALSLILRDEVAGRPLDLRNEGLWGVGSEILLRRVVRYWGSSQKLVHNTEPDHGSDQNMPWMSGQGFKTVRKYYERLIVQYPHHQAHEGATNAMDFYPAMFGIWIYAVQQEGRLHCKQRDGPGAVMTVDDGRSTPLRWPAQVQAPKERTLDQAREIYSRLHDCMGSLPYGDHDELVRLKGMVARWIANLTDDLQEPISMDDDQSGREKFSEA